MQYLSSQLVLEFEFDRQMAEHVNEIFSSERSIFIINAAKSFQVVERLYFGYISPALPKSFRVAVRKHLFGIGLQQLSDFINPQSLYSVACLE